jgi:2-dehydropantoate 2-reductase
MNVAVVGVGGIGGFLGAKLAAHAEEGGHNVYFLARGDHLAAIRRDGLRLQTPNGDVIGRPTDAADDPSGWPTMGLILLCVKGFDLEAAAREIAPLVDTRTVVIPLQNGIRKRQRIERVLPKGLAADGSVYISAHIQGSGQVVFTGGPGRVVFGREPDDVEVLRPYRAVLVDSGVETELVENAAVEVWSKYLFICALAGTTSFFREPLGPILANPQKRGLLEDLMREVKVLARAAEVQLPDDIVSRAMALCASFPASTKSSLLRDLEQGRPNEFEWLIGTMVELGRDYGVELPVAGRVHHGIAAAWNL